MKCSSRHIGDFVFDAHGDVAELDGSEDLIAWHEASPRWEGRRHDDKQRPGASGLPPERRCTRSNDAALNAAGSGSGR